MTNITGPRQGDGGNTLDAESVNELLSGVLRLTAEVSAMRERVSIWECVLESRGVPVARDVDDRDSNPINQPVPEASHAPVLHDAVVSLEAPASTSDVSDSGIGILARLTRLLRRSH